jgi:hypothetical protein
MKRLVTLKQLSAASRALKSEFPRLAKIARRALRIKPSASKSRITHHHQLSTPKTIN